MWSFLSKQPAISKLIARYDELSARDRQALTALAFALLLAVLYFMVWQPAVDFNDRALTSRKNASELLAWMEANESAIEALSADKTTASGRVNRPVDGRALMTLVTRTAGEVDLPLQRFEPSGDDAVRVWLDSVAFTEVAGWLEQLTAEHGIIIDQASIDRANDPGMVSVRLTLTI
jgi:general secretion pathway protein M